MICIISRKQGIFAKIFNALIKEFQGNFEDIDKVQRLQQYTLLQNGKNILPSYM